MLATVLFTDIVGSTERAAEMGDQAWRELLERHHAVVRHQLGRFRETSSTPPATGSSRRSTGRDGAIQCARAVVEAVRELGLEVKAGLHTGECERMGDKLSGIAVPVGARVAAQAEPGEVLVSSTVKDLVAGSEIEFEDRGVHEAQGCSRRVAPLLCGQCLAGNQRR